MAEKMKILVADDDQSILRLLTAILERNDFQPLTARNGAEALTQLAENPDIVLMILDWMMPVMNGLEVLDELEKQSDPPPVLMLSAKTDREDVQEALARGAMDYVLKPVQKDALLFKIDNILERNREQAKARAARRKPVHLQAHTALTITDISETGVQLEASFPVEKDAVIFLESDDLTLKLDQPRNQRYAVRVASCEGKGNHYRIGAEFVGLSPQLQQQIRKVSQSAGWSR
jgi:two-component system chemotaxis response regulator CheY